MTMEILWFVVGVVVLALGADSLVRGLAGLGARLGAGAFAIGVLLTAFAGSAPDLAINVDAVMEGHGSLALGNIIGSCLVNIGLGIGLCALIRPLDVHLPLLKPFVLALMAAGIVLLAAAHNGTFGFLDGGLLVIAFIALGVIAVRHRATRAAPATVAVFEAEGQTRTNVGLNLLRLLIGAALTWYGARMVVGEAVHLAGQWQVSELFAGLTLVAIGSSLPQLVLMIVAAVRGRGDVVVMSAIGSNLVNLTLILGATSLLDPYPVASSLTHLEIPALIAFSAVLYPLFRGDARITRAEGGVLLGAFIAFTAFQIWLVASG
jgi:cation:H+ antiporter